MNKVLLIKSLLFELFEDASMELVTEVLDRLLSVLENDGGGVIRQLTLGLCVAGKMGYKN